MSTLPKARKLFGTDGVRGKANTPPMTADTALKIGQAAGLLFTQGDHRHRVIIGKDTRLSGYMLEPALTAGFISAGMDVLLAGPLPTPAIAMLTRSLRADLGVVISASHNPYEDNGIKLFGPDGFKLSDETEQQIENLIDENYLSKLASPDKLGKATRLDDAGGRYIETVKAAFPKSATLEGLRIVLDCANGAAYRVAPVVFSELGAEVITLSASPDGFNINKNCGSTAPEALSRQVLLHRADIGIALDGDADRLVIIDETGKVVDGDQILALICTVLAKEGRLTGDGPVATVMSNLGLERYLDTLGLKLHRVNVGDRYVAEAMRRLNINIGGEQSGHIILSEFSTTGDGLIAALQVLSALIKSQTKTSLLCRVFNTLPQKLVNLRYSGASPLLKENVQAFIAKTKTDLGAEGRILIRASGTEPLIRVMAECEDEARLEKTIAHLCSYLQTEIEKKGL